MTTTAATTVAATAATTTVAQTLGLKQLLRNNRIIMRFSHPHAPQTQCDTRILLRFWWNLAKPTSFKSLDHVFGHNQAGSNGPASWRKERKPGGPRSDYRHL
jgi:hypothetical protein